MMWFLIIDFIVVMIITSSINALLELYITTLFYAVYSLY